MKVFIWLSFFGLLAQAQTSEQNRERFSSAQKKIYDEFKSKPQVSQNDLKKAQEELNKSYPRPGVEIRSLKTPDGKKPPRPAQSSTAPAEVPQSAPTAPEPIIDPKEVPAEVTFPSPAPASSPKGPVFIDQGSLNYESPPVADEPIVDPRTIPSEVTFDPKKKSQQKPRR